MTKLDNNPRKSSISGIIDIQKLEHESRKYLVSGFILALSMLFAISPFITYKRIRHVKERYRRIKLFDVPVWLPEFYKLELERRLDRERWEHMLKRIDRDFVFKIPRYDLKSILEQEEHRFMAQVEREIQEEIDQMDDSPPLPDSLEIAERAVIDLPEYDTRISRKTEGHLSLQEEMINLDDIDELGKYKGFVIIDPTDKQNIKGFFYIPKRTIGFGTEFDQGSSVVGLAEAFNYYTGLNLKIDQPISFNSPKLMEYPVVYIAAGSRYAKELNRFHVTKFGEYLRNGGFAIIDNCSPWEDYSPAEASLIYLLYCALGEDFELKRIPQDHPVYHCFFDFDGLPPEGAENWSAPIKMPHVYKSRFELPPNPYGRLLHIPALEKVRTMISKSPHSLWGVWLNKRLVAVYSDKGYGHLWRPGTTLYKHRDFSSSDGSRYNFNQQLKMGVNLMVFALLQQGGIAQRYIDYRQWYSQANEPSKLSAVGEE